VHQTGTRQAQCRFSDFDSDEARHRHPNKQHAPFCLKVLIFACRIPVRCPRCPPAPSPCLTMAPMACKEYRARTCQPGLSDKVSTYEQRSIYTNDVSGRKTNNRTVIAGGGTYRIDTRPMQQSVSECARACVPAAQVCSIFKMPCFKTLA
jgi:hypothetical protein